ncbi:phytanoyl-CoA dioxygenase family protein [Alphaproteobacteria bacterium]|nr:phytanoyl-CoA dioxygenase family protein [Alphaproteobacteria bacterium]
MLNSKKDLDYENFINQIDYGFTLINKKHFLDLEKKGFAIINSDKAYWEKNGIDFDYLINKSKDLCEKEAVDKVKEKYDEPNVAQRVSNLANKDRVFIKISKIPDLLNAANYIIKKPFKISSIQIRNPLPFSDAQELHIDWRPRLFNYYSYNQFTAFVYLDDADEDNGSLHVYPGTHKLTGEPSEKYIKENNLLPTKINVKKGNIVLINIYAWHYGGKNHNGKSRKTIFVNYRRRSEWQQLNQKKFLDDNVKLNMSENEKYLYAIRDKDMNQNEFVYRHRNNVLIKTCHKIKDFFQI